ncbi:MAG: NAD(P)-dependent glycerol-1-phosphate dehydrogenase [Candidatus Methanomethylicota archaeon]|nr:NAD(P)-dependent glycerol-1-phosphate dehydrogenase [Candidatus Culexmicrobium cathedralense]RLE48866.1 MAG: NAD(P)-dependent glycerol-1-phosphate dehydrogenase [Candidatus Verstraetearchaeota archaeon]
MRIHEIKLPQDIVVGSGTLNLIAQVCKRLGIGESAVIVTGPKVRRIAGDRVKEILEESKINATIHVSAESSIAEVNKVRELVREVKARAVIGVGGGKAIDIAKLSAFKENIPFISMPTAASHDGIASPRASLRGLNGPTSMPAKPPVAIIADVDLIIQAPYRLLASGCGDIIAKFTAVRDWRLAHKLRGEYYGDYAASLAVLSANIVVKHAEYISRRMPESLRTIVEALISCGIAMCIAGSSRPCSGSEHLFSHALDLIAKKPALHGEQCGVGAIMMMYLHGGNWRKIRKTLKIIGAPTTAKELGVSDYEIIKALTIAHKIRPDRYTILGESGLSWEAAEKVARITGVIE